MSPLSFQHGFYGGEWQKSPVPLGISDIVEERVINLALPAGTSNVDGSACPSGEIWIITNIGISYVGTVTGVTIDANIVNTSAITIFKQTGIVSGALYDRQGFWVIKPDGLVRLLVQGATLNNDGYLFYSGYKIDIDQ